MSTTVKRFGHRLRELRTAKRLTLRELAHDVGIDFTYLSKIENAKVGYLPGTKTIRAIAEALDAEAFELLVLADKVPQEVQKFAESATVRQFFQRAQEVARPEDWDLLLKLLEHRHRQRSHRKRGQRN
jgi:transcriptional regulator with XRE-family HTH domain